jgi:quinol monooxygenase YgiN
MRAHIGKAGGTKGNASRIERFSHAWTQTKGNPMPCYVMLEFTAKKGTGHALLEGLRGELPTTRSKNGCQSLELTVNQDSPDNMIILMRWASRQHYAAYRTWREANGDVSRFANATEAGLSTRFFDITDLRGAARLILRLAAKKCRPQANRGLLTLQAEALEEVHAQMVAWGVPAAWSAHAALH